MASGWDIAGGIGSGLADFATNRNAQALNQEAFDEHLQDRDFTLLERAEKLKEMRQNLDIGFQQLHPEVVQEAALQEHNKRIAPILAQIDADKDLTPLQKTLFKYSLSGSKEEIPQQLLTATVKPTKELDAAIKGRLDGFRLVYGRDPKSRAEKELVAFGKQEKPPPSEGTKDILKAREVVAERDRLRQKQHLPPMTPEERAKEEEAFLQDPDEKADRRLQTIEKPKISEGLRNLKLSEKGLRKAEAANKKFASIVGPGSGRLEKLDPYRKAEAQKLITEFGRLLLDSVNAAKAGARGFTRFERPFFEQFIPAITNTPEQNKAIIEDGLEYIRDQRSGWMDDAKTYQFKEGEFSAYLTPSAPVAGSKPARSSKISKQAFQ